MRRTKSKIMGFLLLVSMLLAGPAMAAPADGFGWLGWVESAWSSLLEAVGVTSAQSSTEEEPEPAPAPPPSEPDGSTTTNECLTCDPGDSRGTLDPNG